MSANEGPDRSDFRKSREVPACGDHCAHVHGDQADPEHDELIELRAKLNKYQGVLNLIVDALGTGLAHEISTMPALVLALRMERDELKAWRQRITAAVGGGA